MLKRLLWLMVGIGFGFGMSFWVTRLLRDKIGRLSPDHLTGEVSKALRDLGRDVRAAVSEGREAAREREAALRAAIDPGAPR